MGAHTRIWVPNYKEEIDRALDAGADVINFVGAAGPLQAQALHPELMGDRFLDQASDAISYSNSRGAFVVFGSADPGNLRCFHDWLLAAIEAGADRIQIYDGRGWFLPETVELKRSLFFGPTALQRGATGPVGLKISKMGLEPDENLIDRVIERLEEKMKTADHVSESELEAVIETAAKIKQNA